MLQAQPGLSERLFIGSIITSMCVQVEMGDADSKGPRLKLWGSWVVSKGEEPPEAGPEAAPDSFNAMGTARIALTDVLRAGQSEGAWKVGKTMISECLCSGLRRWVSHTLGAVLCHQVHPVTADCLSLPADAEAVL